MASIAEEPDDKPWSMARVVIASSAGTAFEWYDFFIFGSLAPVISHVFFAGLEPTPALIAALALFAAGFAFRPLGALIFGVVGDRLGRKGAFLITVSLMGGGDLPDRLPSDLRAGRNTRADAPHHPSNPPGDRARRRIWRGRNLRRRACAEPQARRFDRLDPVVRLLRPARCAAGNRRHAPVDRRGSVRGVGMANPVPRLRGPARGLGVDARKARREPPFRPPPRRGRDRQGAAARSVRPVAQPQKGPHRLLRDHVRARRGLVLRLLLPSGLPRKIARRSRRDQGPAADRDDGRQRAALCLLRLAERPDRSQVRDGRRDAACAGPLLPRLALDRRPRQIRRWSRPRPRRR